MNELTKQDLETIYNAAWAAGAINLLGLANALPKYIEKARNTPYGDKHPAIQLLLGHMSFLAGGSLGPDEEIAKQVKIMIDDENPSAMDYIFKNLPTQDREEFRQWAKDNQTPEQYKKRNILHPIVRDEWEKIGYKGK